MEDDIFFGKIPVRTEITVLSADELRTLKLGIVWSEPKHDIVVYTPGFLGHKCVKTTLIE